ncbi:cupredoxin domain-containing protein [Candidatus Pacearchaeota archaeon]|nr:cupredoxin domain-containing protein [Candidatus Pacearchaeota archaeon]
MKNTTMLAMMILLIIAGGIFIISRGSTNSDGKNGETVAVIEGDAQKITLGTKNLNYYPNTIKVTEGKPVELTLDESVTGCLRSFTIKDLGVSKYARTPNEKIVFTPTKKGTFTFACSMGMGFGKLIVE